MFTNRIVAEFPYTREQLFDMMSDIRNELRWMPGVKEVQLVGGGRVGAGSVFEARYDGFGAMRIRITEFERPSTWSCAVEGKPVDMRCRFDYEPASAGARADVRIDVMPHGPLRLVQPLLKWMFRREFAKRPSQILNGLRMIYPEQAERSRLAAPPLIS